MREENPAVRKRSRLFDPQLGFAVAADRFRLSFTHLFRTKEYRTQPQSDQFGAINLTIQT